MRTRTTLPHRTIRSRILWQSPYMRFFVRALGVTAAYLAVVGATFETIVLLWRWEGRQYFHSVNPTVGAAIVAAAATITVSLLTLVLGRIFERQKAIETELRAAKRPVHTELVDGLFAVFQAKSPEEQQAAAIKLFNERMPELITLASDEVLVAWSRYKRRVTQLALQEQMLELERVLMAIRRDHGHSGRGVREGDLLGLFITDSEDLFVKRRRRRIRPRPLPLKRGSTTSPGNSAQTPAQPAPTENAQPTVTES